MDTQLPRQPVCAVLTDPGMNVPGMTSQVPVTVTISQHMQ